MKIIHIEDFEDARVTEFLTAQKFLPIQQTLSWAKFQKSLEVESFRLAVLENEKVIAFAQIFVKKLPFGLSKIEIPRGPLLHGTWNMEHRTEILDLLISEIEKITAEQNSIFVRFEFQENLNFDLPRSKKVDEENFPLATLRIDLQKPLDEILAEMKPKGRYNINVAKKHGIQVSIENSADDFFALLEKTTARDGFSGHPKSFYQKMIDELGGDCVLLVAKKGDQPIAAIIVTFGGDTATYYFGASDYEFRNLMASYLLQFEAIKIAKERGCHFYDFLGVAPKDSSKHHLAGVSDFKKKLGGEVVEYPRPRIVVFKPIFYWLLRLAKFLRS